MRRETCSILASHAKTPPPSKIHFPLFLYMINLTDDKMAWPTASKLKKIDLNMLIDSIKRYSCWKVSTFKFGTKYSKLSRQHFKSALISSLHTCMVMPMKSIHQKSSVFEENRIAVEAILVQAACKVVDNNQWRYNKK